jgi:hypothetical protein
VSPTAPNGPGSPGRAGGSGRPSRSSATGVAAAGPCGACRSLSFARPRALRGQLSGGWSAGRRRSYLPVAAPGGRAHACRSPRRPHGGRWQGPGENGLEEGRASARGPTGMCRRDRRRSPPARRWRSSGPGGPGTFRRGCRRPAAGSPGQVDRDRHRRPGRVPVRGDCPRGEVAVVQVDRQYRMLPQPVQRCRGCGRSLPRRVDVPPAACRVVADVIADRAAGRLGGDLTASVRKCDRG